MSADNLSNLQSRIEAIEKRNREVELNKSWEASWTRKLLVAVFTYLSIALYFNYILEVDPWLNAIVPTAGFLLSTLTLPFLKSLWKTYLYKNP